MGKYTVIRIGYGIILLLSAFVLPWWVAALLSIVGLLYFKNLYEVIAVGVILDSLYGSALSIAGFSFVFTTIALCAFYIVARVRKNILI